MSLSPIPNDAQSDSSLFGRDGFLATIEERLEAYPNEAIVLQGAPGVGKSSLLDEVRSRAVAGTAVSPILLDLERIGQDRLGMFWYELAQSAVVYLENMGFMLPPQEQTAYIENPYATFNSQFLQPLQERLEDGKRPLFLFDNTDALCQRLEESQSTLKLLDELHQFIQLDSTATIFSITSTECVERYAFLTNAKLHAIEPLSLEAVREMICSPNKFTAVADVTRYIHTLTGGNPAALKQLCQILHQQPSETARQQLTIADVALIQGKLQASNGRSQAHTLQSSHYSVGPTAAQRQAIRIAHSKKIWARSRPVLFLLLLLLLLLGGTAVISQFIGQRSNAAIAGLFTTQSTATVTSIPSPSPKTTRAGAALIEATAVASTSPLSTPTKAKSQPTAATEITATSLPLSLTSTPTPAVALPLSATRIRELDGMPTIFIAAGTFQMGSLDDNGIAAPDEFPVHQVSLDNFYLDKYEVSVAQYAAFLNELGSYERTCNDRDCNRPRDRVGYTSYLVKEDFEGGDSQFLALSGFADYPANHISWYGATAYCSYVGGRLPTEAEWEFAARGTEGRIYPWGDEPAGPGRAIFNSQNYADLQPVDALPRGATPDGIFGMAGSVWEWTADWHDEKTYERGSVTNPTGPESGLVRVIRGGAWPFDNQEDRIRAANRHSLPPAFFSSSVGFRCALTP